jgi:hypothetical protein
MRSLTTQVIYGKESVGKYRLLQTKKWDKPYPSDLLRGEVVHGLPGQDTVGLTQPFPQLADGLVRLFLSCAEDPVDPGFEFGRSAF